MQAYQCYLVRWVPILLPLKQGLLHLTLGIVSAPAFRETLANKIKLSTPHAVTCDMLTKHN